MKLYSMNMINEVISIKVLKETPKGYKVDPKEKPWGINDDGWGVKFIRKKTMTQWFPTRLMALQWGREILKRRVSFAENDLHKAKENLSKRKAELKAFDADHKVVSADIQRGGRNY